MTGEIVTTVLRALAAVLATAALGVTAYAAGQTAQPSAGLASTATAVLWTQVGGVGLGMAGGVLPPLVETLVPPVLAMHGLGAAHTLASETKEPHSQVGLAGALTLTYSVTVSRSPTPPDKPRPPADTSSSPSAPWWGSIHGRAADRGSRCPPGLSRSAQAWTGLPTPPTVIREPSPAFREVVPGTKQPPSQHCPADYTPAFYPPPAPARLLLRYAGMLVLLCISSREPVRAPRSPGPAFPHRRAVPAFPGPPVASEHRPQPTTTPTTGHNKLDANHLPRHQIPRYPPQCLA
jgi:hypothetical protein